MTDPVLKNLSTPPKAGKHDLYRWCDYIELRCLTHIDQRFSRDGFVEAISENVDTNKGSMINEADADDEEVLAMVGGDEDADAAPTNDRHEEHAANCFKHLRWREHVFVDSWPFTLDEHVKEIRLKPELTEAHHFYLSLLLSASLRYVPQKRWRGLTGLFEKASVEVMKQLMPRGAEVHPFGAAETERYKGHLFDKLTQLTKDVRGSFSLKKAHFAPNDTGDSGLDIVAWHGLGDERTGIPIAFAQCGCTAEGWPKKMLEASPAHLGTHLNTQHPWSTYYFMPLDLSTQIDGEMDWHMLSDFSTAIVIDRLRFIKLTTIYEIPSKPITAQAYIEEARALKLN